MPEDSLGSCCDSGKVDNFLPPAVQLEFSQEAIVSGFRFMFPSRVLHGFALPMLEDPFFPMFHTWCTDRQLDVAATHLMNSNTIQPSLGVQAAVLDHKKALPSMVTLFRSKEETFELCCAASECHRLPFDDMACCEDFSFAAFCAVKCMHLLREHRKCGRGLLRELSSRRRPLSNHLRKYMPKTVASVAGHVHIGLLAVPTFVHEQPCGKRRRIDDARAGQQNSATAFSERFNMVSAMMPATAARVLWAWASQLGVTSILKSMRLLTAGEDLPNAYRIIPVLPQHLRHNNVAVKHPLSGEVCIFPCWALLFGFASSVFQFERFSFFLEAVGRRALHLMVSLFVSG